MYLQPALDTYKACKSLTRKWPNATNLTHETSEKRYKKKTNKKAKVEYDRL